MASATKRKNKLVVLASRLEPGGPPPPASSLYTKKLQSSTGARWNVTLPLNDYNIVLLENHGEPGTKEEEKGALQVNFFMLCCHPEVGANDIPYSFAEYAHVTHVTYSGHIGSMRAVFGLLQGFPSCKTLGFHLNDDNIRLRDGYYSTFDMYDPPKLRSVESLSISQDFSVMDRKSIDVQENLVVPWRLDEILCCSYQCLPNLKKLSMDIHGTGANFGKVVKFIECMPYLHSNFQAEIVNEKIRIRALHKSESAKKRQSRNNPACKPSEKIINPSSEPVEIDLSRVKEEIINDQVEQNHDDYPWNCQDPVGNAGIPFNDNVPPLNLPPPYLSNYAPVFNPISFNGNMPPGACGFMASGHFLPNMMYPSGYVHQSISPDLKNSEPIQNDQKMRMFKIEDPRIKSKVGDDMSKPADIFSKSTDSAYSEYTEDEEDSRLRTARNPSPPPSNRVHLSDASSNESTKPNAGIRGIGIESAAARAGVAKEESETDDVKDHKCGTPDTTTLSDGTRIVDTNNKLNATTGRAYPPPPSYSSDPRLERGRQRSYSRSRSRSPTRSRSYTSSDSGSRRSSRSPSYYSPRSRERANKDYRSRSAYRHKSDYPRNRGTYKARGQTDKRWGTNGQTNTWSYDNRHNSAIPYGNGRYSGNPNYNNTRGTRRGNSRGRGRGRGRGGRGTSSGWHRGGGFTGNADMRNNPSTTNRGENEESHQEDSCE